MAGIHGLEHVHGLGAADFADDDAVRAHAQCVAHQRALRDFTAAFYIGRTRFHAHHMRLLQLQLGRILDGDHAFHGGNVARKNIEQRCLAGARAPEMIMFTLALAKASRVRPCPVSGS